MTPKQARLGVDVFTGLVVASVALALANLSWRLMGYAGEEPVISLAGQGQSDASNIAPLIALSPFGIASGMIADSGAGGNGGLTLRAIFAAFPASESVALIAGPDGNVIPVSIGDATPGGIVEAIEPEKIMLRTSNGLRILGFDPDEGTSVAAGYAPASPAPAAGIGTAQTRPALPAAPAPSGVDAIRALIPEGARSGAATTSAPPPPPPPPPPPARSPSAAPLTLSPQSSSPASGYRVGSRLPPQLRTAGIRTGDIIRTVNGNPVSGNATERELFSRAMGSSSAQIELVRDGKRVSLSVPMR